jgi:peptidoglycan/LPS O-acetylase OafA/YrhL
LFKLFSDLKLSLPVLTRIGQLSFSIYIFHFLFAYPLVSKLVDILSVRVNSYLLYVLSVIITVGLAMIVASVSERLIEKPGINTGKMLIKRLKNRAVLLKPGQ